MNIIHKIIITLSLFIIFQGYATAQQRSFGQWSTKATGGYHIGGTWGASIGAEKNFGLTKHSVSGEFISFEKKYKIHTENLALTNISLLMQYNYTPMNWKFLVLGVGAGGFIGVNLYSDTEYMTIPKPVALSAGIAASLNIEFVLTQKLAICIVPVLLVDFAQDIETLGLSASNRFKGNLMGGFKYFL